MSKGMSRSQGSSGENIQHFSHIRLRVVGAGVLRGQLTSLDNIRSVTIPNYTMASASRIEPTLLTNFVEQRARLKLETTAINEWMRINRIIIYLKDYAAEYPM